ncbi:MAG: hypothetical protein ACFFED_03735 [Candidatus Thorarchaeota archaeon]
MDDDITDTLEGIELTPEAKKAVPDIEFVYDIDRAKELDDSVRLAILQVLRKGVEDTKTTKTKDPETGDTIIRQREVTRKALSVVEIVKMSEDIEYVENVTKNQVYHHLPKLIEMGYVIKLGTVTTGKRTTDYYRRTAGGFVLITGVLSAADEKMLRKKNEKVTQKMMQHFKINITEEEQKRFENLRFDALKIELAARKEIVKLIRSDVADKDVLDMYEFLLQMYALGNEEYIEIHKKIRDLLFK